MKNQLVPFFSLIHGQCDPRLSWCIMNIYIYIKVVLLLSVFVSYSCGLHRLRRHIFKLLHHMYFFQRDIYIVAFEKIRVSSLVLRSYPVRLGVLFNRSNPFPKSLAVSEQREHFRDKNGRNYHGFVPKKFPVKFRGNFPY